MSKILAPQADPASQKPENAGEPAPDTGKPAPVPEDTLPEKYRGKTVEEVAEMHRNAEQELGRTRNELHSTRGLVKDLSQLNRTAPEAQPAPQVDVELSGDDLISDPVGSIRKVVQQETAQLKQETAEKNEQTRVHTEATALESEFGDVAAIVQSPEFREFAGRTVSRQMDMQTAANGEGLDQVRAARRLLEDFTDFQKQANPDKTPAPKTPVEQAKAVATEGAGGGGPISSKPQVFESDVIALINSDPAKYRSPSFQAELMSAIKEGRFVKNS
jgi:hypothetical protein